MNTTCTRPERGIVTPHRVLHLLGTIVLAGSAFWSQALAQSGRIEQGTISSLALRNNLFGDPSTRSFRVYLPPGYDRTQKRFPVFYVLHGWGSDENTFATKLKPSLDSMIRQRSIGEMIAVFVNGGNRLGGSWYLSSPVIGDYETYVATDLVQRIDSHYRTLADRNSRGITGFSMGGWGAMHLALKFPSTFSVVVAQSGLYDSRGVYVDGLSRQLGYLKATNLVQFDRLPFPAIVVQAMWAGLLPNPQRPGLYMDTPYELINGQLVLSSAAHQRSLEGDVTNGDVSRYLQQAARLNAIKILHGTSDTVVPISEARQFTNALSRAGIGFSYEEHSGAHQQRPELVLPFLSAHLAGAELYILPPRLNLAASTNGFQLTFHAQTNVDYTIESCAAVEGSSMLWTAWNRVAGSNQPVSVNLPSDTERQFLRVRAANIPP